jgi:hypothetical protein
MCTSNTTLNRHTCDDGEMKDRWPWLLLLVVPMVLFPGALPGPQVVSADDHLSVHHAFQTEAGGHIRHPHLSDPALQFKALRKAVEMAIQDGEAPLWNPTIWAGAPLIGDAQSMVGSPVTWLHLLLSDDLAADAAVVWLLLWIGLGTGLLSRQLGASTWGSVTAAAGGMTAPYISVWLLHPHAATAVWLPWLLLSLERSGKLSLSLCTAGLLMGGHPETALHVGLIVIVWWAVRVRSIAPLMWMLLGCLLSAPIWLPFVEEVLRSATLAAHGGNTLAMGQLMDLVWPGWHGHPVNESWTPQGWVWADGRIHPGLGVLALAMLAALRKIPTSRLLMGVFVAGIFLSVVGLPGPFNHARLAAITACLVAVAAGLAVRQTWGPATFALVVLTGAWAGWNDQGSVNPAVHSPDPAPWTKNLSKLVGDGRVIGLGWALQPNTGALTGLHDLRGYDLPVSKDTERLQSALRPRPIRPWFRLDAMPPMSLLRFAGVRAVLSPEPVNDSVDIGPAPLYVQTIPDAQPPAWKATAPQAVANENEGIEALLKATPSTPPAEGLAGSWPKKGHVQDVQDFQRTSRTVSFTVDGPDAGLAVLSDAWHPGWQVQINGEQAAPLRVGGVFRGVLVQAGRHHVVWNFNPWGWRFGWGLFWAGLGCLAVLITTPKMRQKNQ